jgi:hypothetical protein
MWLPMSGVLTMPGPGSIALVQFTADDQDPGTPVVKNFSFVLLDLSLRGQTITFTDNGWLATGGFRAGEGSMTFTVPADAALGTVFTISTLTGSFNPSTAGDAIIAYVGSAASPTILFAVQFASGSAAWAADASSANTSAVPTGLVNGDTALAFAFDNGAYAGPLTGTAAEILANIANEANWTTNDTLLVAAPGNFTVNAGGGGPTLSINDVTAVEGDSGTVTFTFTVTRSDNSTDVTFDIATADGTATAGSDYVANALSGVTMASGGALTQTFTVTVNGDTATEANETFFVNLTNVTGATLTDGQGQGTISNDDTSIVRIYDIQGAGHRSPFEGQSVVTRGIVTAVDSNGFYIQDATGDGNSATSDGVFVFTSTAPTVSVGQDVQVTGTVTEFLQSNNVQRLTLTEITAPTISVLSSGNALPAAVLIGPDGVSPPSANIEDDNFTSFQPATDGLDFWESLEGMRVTVQDPISISGTNTFNEFYAISTRDWVSTNATGFNANLGVLVIDGAVGGGINVNNTIGGDFNPERIQLQVDATVTPGGLPTGISPGARLNDVTGIVNYNAGQYEVIATTALTVAQASTNTVDNTMLLGSSTHLTIGSYNAENLDPGDGAARFTALANDIAFALGAPGIVVLDEIQDNNGPTNDSVVSASLTLQMLVDAIFAVSGVQYSWIDNPFITDDRNGGEPGGNIRVAMLYRTDTVSLVAGSVRTATDPTDQATNSANPFFGSRLPLAADFLFNGQTVTVIGNHFTSKGGSSPLLGSIQPSTNAGEDRRAGQASLVNALVDTILAGNANANIVVAGDFNDFQNEEPLRILTGQNDWNGTAAIAPSGPQVLNNLSFLLPPEERFSYIFEGNAQQIDHILVSNALSAGAQFDIVHRNTLFGEINSDHDALVTRLFLPPAPINGTAGSETLTGTAGNDTINGLDGNDVLFGGGGEDQFNGGAGDDVIVVDSAGDVVTENANEGTDRVETALAAYTLTANVENLEYTGSGAFSGTGNDLNNAIVGGALGDTLSGLDGNDTLGGEAGDDVLNGGNGNDRLIGGTGADTMNGGDGDDILVRDNSGDVANGGAGADTVELHGGGDYTAAGDIEIIAVRFANPLTSANIVANGLDNQISGGSAADVIQALGGNDIVYGRGGGDTIIGGLGVDRLFGEAGDDSLFGQDGNDLLYGGDGADRLFGGNGVDTMWGGTGADIFGYDAISETGATRATADIIGDFSRAQGDRIDLSVIDAIAGGVPTDAFTFIGTAAFGNVAGQLRYDVVGGASFVSGDINGDGIADFVIRVNGVTNLQAGDFIL